MLVTVSWLNIILVLVITVVVIAIIVVGLKQLIKFVTRQVLKEIRDEQNKEGKGSQ